MRCNSYNKENFRKNNILLCKTPVLDQWAETISLNFHGGTWVTTSLILENFMEAACTICLTNGKLTPPTQKERKYMRAVLEENRVSVW